MSIEAFDYSIVYFLGFTTVSLTFCIETENSGLRPKKQQGSVHGPNLRSLIR